MDEARRIGQYRLGELVAVGWNDEMAVRFPNADHTGCRQQCYHDGTSWEPYVPPRCNDWHCNRCGAPTNSYGHHRCPDRPVDESSEGAGDGCA